MPVEKYPRSRREKPIEMYANTGYFAFTGRRLEGTPASLEERQAEISELYDREFPERKPLTKTPRERAKLRSEGSATPRMKSSARSSSDRSGSDYANCRELARAGYSPEQIYEQMQNDPIAQQSKWAERDDNYKKGVINAAVTSL